MARSKKKTKLQELRERNPWKASAEKKGRGRKQKGAAALPISAKLNKQRADLNSIEFQLKHTFGI